MKQVNKDYISVVRSSNGRLLYERIPIIKSEKIKNKLVALAEDEHVTIEGMLDYLHGSRIFRFLALPYYEAAGDIDFSEQEDWSMFQLTKALKMAKTKVQFLDKALSLIEECDYRWNAIRISTSFPDVIIRSHSAYETTYVTIKLNQDTKVIFECRDLGCGSDGVLSYTVFWNGASVRPYRSVVQLCDCSDDILDVTKMFDPEEGQWDNALKSLVATTNVILQDQQEYFKKKVVEAGQFMLEKIKQLYLDPESYISWLEDIEDKISVDYSECTKSPSLFDYIDESNRTLYILMITGRKMYQAILLANNLRCWAELGPEFCGMDKVYADLVGMASGLLRKMEDFHDSLPQEVFEDDYGELDLAEYERHHAALNLRYCCERIRGLMNMEKRFESDDDEDGCNDF